MKLSEHHCGYVTAYASATGTCKHTRWTGLDRSETRSKSQPRRRQLDLRKVELVVFAGVLRGASMRNGLVVSARQLSSGWASRGLRITTSRSEGNRAQPVAAAEGGPAHTEW